MSQSVRPISMPQRSNRASSTTFNCCSKPRSLFGASRRLSNILLQDKILQKQNLQKYSCKNILIQKSSKINFAAKIDENTESAEKGFMWQNVDNLVPTVTMRFEPVPGLLA